jgi:PAS domain S-box-containing protein
MSRFWVEEMTAIDLKKDITHTKKSQELILTLTPNEEIIQFNRGCEQFTGYRRGEVLHHKFSELFLPTEFFGEWKTHLTSIRQSQRVDEFVLPIKTKNDQTVSISWNGILIRDANDSITDICLFGQPQKTNDLPEHPVHTVPLSVSSRKDEKEPSPSLPTQKKSNKAEEKKHGKKKLLFAREKEPENEHTDMSPLRDDFTQPLEHIQKTLETTTEKLDSLNISLQDLHDKYNTLSLRLEKVEKKDWSLEKNHSIREKHGGLLEENTRRSERKQKEIENGPIFFGKDTSKQNKLAFLPNPFGFRRRHSELTAQKQHIETQMSQLSVFQDKLANERKAFNARVEDFCKWREKLELLEIAIEKRRQELMNQEEVFLNPKPAPPQATVPSPQDHTDMTESKTSPSHEFIESITQSAAIIQRGIVKHINANFATLLGYSLDEVIEKSFFDFIAQDGLADIERYYLERLKGEDVSVYKTVFSTKDNNKVAVEVNVKQTLYNGEKAEIAIVTELEKSTS